MLVRVNVPSAEEDAHSLPPDEVLHVPGGGERHAGRALHQAVEGGVEVADPPLLTTLAIQN